MAIKIKLDRKKYRDIKNGVYKDMFEKCKSFNISNDILEIIF